jgi:hypothetical protein
LNAGFSRPFPDCAEIDLSIGVAIAAAAVKMLAKALLGLEVHESTHSPPGRFHVDVAMSP